MNHHNPRSHFPLTLDHALFARRYYWWNDKLDSSAGRAKVCCEGLFRKCVEGGVGFEHERMGVFDYVRFEETRTPKTEAEKDGYESDSKATVAARVRRRLGDDVVRNKLGKFESAYASDGRVPPRWTNVTTTFKGALDHLFFREGELTVTGVLELPRTLEELGGVLPTAVWPSDHLCLVAGFRFEARDGFGH